MSSEQHVFLSPEWIEAARAIRDEYAGAGPTLPPVSVNEVIVDVPFGDGTLQAHIDTSSGRLELDLGHLERADVTLTLDYPTARALLVDQDPSAIMQAFIGGKILVQGDITKLIAMQAGFNPAALGEGTDAARALQEIGDRIRAMTA